MSDLKCYRCSCWPCECSDGCAIVCGDSHEIVPQLDAGIVDAVITDPPYPKKYMGVWDVLGKPCYDAAKDDAFLSTLCGHFQLPHVINTCINHGWEWWWPCIATNNNQPIMHGYKVKCCHKPNPIFRKGKARPNRIFCDNFTLRTKTKDWQESQSLHKWGQADSLFYEPIDAFTTPGSLILDPFLGGGTVLVAAKRMGRRGIGIEIDEANCEIAANRLATEPMPLIKEEVGA